jgi:type II secretory pathway component PulC
MPDKVTPEEKLLKIIEQTAARKKPARGPRPGFKLWLASLRLEGLNWARLKSVELKTINKALAGAAFALSLFLLFNFLNESYNLNKRYRQLSISQLAAQVSKKSSAAFEVDFVKLQHRMQRRNIFSFIPPSPEEEVVAPEFKEVMENLQLVGVIWSDKPQVMIEDASAKKTYLLSTGDALTVAAAGLYKIKKIFRDKVVIEATIDSEVKEWELR